MSLMVPSNKALLLLAALLALGGMALGAWLLVLPSPRSFPELDGLSSATGSFTDLSRFFAELAEHKGATYAYAALKVAPLPPETDLHLLGHVVGDKLYKQEGAAGIRVCTQDFRNACSHSIVVGLFSDKGEAALPEIADACRKAPGGSGAYTMCFHGLGHGILAETGYDLAETVALCKETGTPERGKREYAECVGGAIMEIIGGGGHDRELWAAQRPKYLTKNDPLSPCSTDIIPPEAKQMCYLYLTPHLFEVAGADLGIPGEEDFRRAFPLCGKIPETEVANLGACYGGFGKEFVGLAPHRDIRRIEELSDGELKKILAWCMLADRDPEKGACITNAVSSLYWGGENKPATAIRFCELISEAPLQDGCFSNLIGMVGYFVQDVVYRKNFCGELPTDVQTECKRQLAEPS